jgi:phosphohistidine phosphatase
MNRVKELLLLRHGAAESPGNQSGDMERNLTPSGENQVERLAGMLKENHQKLDLIVHSKAKRCVKTANIMAQYLLPKQLLPSPVIYRADYAELLALINELPKEMERVMLVGHNPTISFFVSYLSGEQHMMLSPGMMARIKFSDLEWEMVSQGTGTLEEVLQ